MVSNGEDTVGGDISELGAPGGLTPGGSTPGADAKLLITRFAEAARAAEKAGDWAAVRDNWRQVREHMQDDPAAYVGEARAMRILRSLAPAEALLRSGIARCSPHPGILCELAECAANAGNHTEAVRRWSEACEAFPDCVPAHTGLSYSLTVLGRFDEAEKLTALLPERFPHRPDAHAAHAKVAAARADWTESARRWAAVSERFPDMIAAYQERAQALEKAGQGETAMKILREGLHRFPAHFALAGAFSASLARRGLIDEAVAVSALMRAVHPDQPAGYGEPAKLLMAAHRPEEAAAMLREGLLRFPKSVALLRVRAELAGALRDWKAAREHWRAVLDIEPANRPALFGIAEASVELRQAGDAIAPLGHALAETPDHPKLLHLLGRAHLGLGDAARAHAIFAGLAAARPNDSTVSAALFEARMAMMLESPGQSAADAALSAPPAPEILRKPEHDLRDMMLRFEGLGSNCEFGLVQRHVGAEPLGLLRWTSLFPAELVRALDQEFAGVGEAENTTLDSSGTDYYTVDANYRMMMHTFIKPDSVLPEVFFPQVLRRLRFLARKMREDLRAAEKIFVYKANVTEDEATAILASLRRYGDNRLFCVKEAGNGARAGSVIQLKPYLWIGYVEKFAPFGGNVDYANWLKICKQVDGLAHQKLAA